MSNETFDFSDWEADYAGADGRDKSQKFVPETGNYMATITKTWLKPTKDGSPSLKWAMRLLDGKFPGESIFKTNFIRKGDPKSLQKLKTDLMTAGLSLNSLDELNSDDARSKVNGQMVSVSVKVTDPSKGYYDVYINRRIDATELQ